MIILWGPAGAHLRLTSIYNVYTNVFHSQRPIFCPGNNMQTQVAQDAPLTEGPDTSCVAAPCPPHSIGESVAAGCDCEPGYSGALGRRKKLHRQETPNSAGGRKPMQQIQAAKQVRHYRISSRRNLFWHKQQRYVKLCLITHQDLIPELHTRTSIE